MKQTGREKKYQDFSLSTGFKPVIQSWFISWFPVIIRISPLFILIEYYQNGRPKTRVMYLRHQNLDREKNDRNCQREIVKYISSNVFQRLKKYQDIDKYVISKLLYGFDCWRITSYIKNDLQGETANNNMGWTCEQ